MALPQFWVGLVLISIFFVDLRWLPGPVGRLPIGIALPPKITGFLLVDTLLAGRAGPVVAGGRSSVALPALTLGFSAAAPIARVTRSAMAEAHAERLRPHGHRHGPRPPGRGSATACATRCCR